MVHLSPPKAAAPARFPDRTDRRPASRLRAFLDAAYGLDLRSLALFRIGLAAAIIADLLWRARDLRAFYTDFGVLPRAVLLDRFADPWLISLHLMSGTALVQVVLFLVALIFGLLLLLGYRTRPAAVVSWFLLISLQNRNPIVLQGGDILLRMLAFWAMFVPLNAYFSLDRALDTSGVEPPSRVFSAGAFGLLAQVVLLYWFSALLKSAPEWRSQLSAVYYAFSLQQFATPLGHFLLRFPGLLRILTWLTLVVETVAPILLLSPWRPGPARAAGVLLLFALQGGLVLCLHLGHFPWVAAVAIVALIPSWAWRPAGRGGPRGDRRPAGLRAAAVYYDGTCAFCRKSVAVLKMFLLPADTPVLAAQDDPWALDAMRREHSWVVLDQHGGRHVRAAALAVLLHGSVWSPLAVVLERRPGNAVADAAYRWVADHRSLLSRLVAPLHERPLTLRTPRLAGFVAAFFIAYVLWWNLGTVSSRLAMPDRYRWIGVATRTDQAWDMFAPYPLRDDGWYVIEGTLHSGRRVDVFRGGAPVSFATPSPSAIAAQYKDERWRKYLTNLYLAANTDYRPYYGRYLCRSWNAGRPAGDPGQLDTFQIYFMLRTNVLWNERPGAYQKVLLHNHHCF